jgi:protein-S-isoprenylcysteine O-methyltransferase Ste14
MKKKIPPPIVTLLFGLAIYLMEDFFPLLRIPYAGMFCIGFVTLGLGIFIAAVLSFKKYQTTVNPLKPETASTLVVDGIFGLSRNPMYLGMLMMLWAIAIQFNPVGGLIFCPLFVVYLNVFQIMPEEEAMTGLFKGEYLEYQQQVRRWV